MGFRHVKQKFAEAGLTPVASELVRPPRVAECPVQLEVVVDKIHSFGDDYDAAIEVRIVRVYMDEAILSAQKRHYVDADKWRPLIMSFCEFYGLGENVHPSKLAEVF